MHDVKLANSALLHCFSQHAIQSAVRDSLTCCCAPGCAPLSCPADSTNPTVDWLTDLATDVPQWAIKEATIGFESVQAIMGVSHCGCCDPS
jgi:hypothetical protein